MDAFLPWQKQNSDFQFLAFPIGYVRGFEVTVGSEDHLQFFFLKGIFAQEGIIGTRIDHGQFEIKNFPIYAPP